MSPNPAAAGGGQPLAARATSGRLMTSAGQLSDLALGWDAAGWKVSVYIGGKMSAEWHNSCAEGVAAQSAAGALAAR
jgi:hypothetical protein